MLGSDMFLKIVAYWISMLFYRGYRHRGLRIIGVLGLHERVRGSRQTEPAVHAVSTIN